MVRGSRSITPSVFISISPFQRPAIVQPSPTLTATQSGTPPKDCDCSAISRPPVFLPSTSTGLIVAASFLIIGMFIDAIPAIIILGTVLWPLAEVSQMHPIHFAIIGVISLAFGLVTPPYGLCLLIACRIGDIEVKDALRDVAIVLMPMFVVLLIVIFFPELILALPKLLMAKFI